MTVLGISTSSRVLGLAVLKGEDLHDYRIRQFQERWSPVKIVRLLSSIQSFLQQYSITSVALAIPYEYRTSKESTALLSKITSYCKKKNLTLTTYRVSPFYEVCKTPKGKKKAVMRQMTLQYPELKVLYRKELRNSRPYYCKVFEAVAVAKLVSNQS